MFLIKKAIPVLWAVLFLIVSFCSTPVKAQSNDPTQLYFEISKNLEIMTNVFKELNSSYVNPIQPGTMTKTGINAMLEGLDPYTNFFTEADAENYKINVLDEYGGIGIVVKKKDSLFLVAKVFENSSAAQAGIHPGDIIISVNGQSLKNRTEDELSILMRGDKGSSLKIEIQNPMTRKVQKKDLKKSEIKVSDIPYFGLMGSQKNIAYVHLSQFMGPSSFQIRQALDSLKRVQPELLGVILDLRGNPGGLLKEAVRTCNLFIQKGQTVVTTKGKGEEWTKTFQTTGETWNTEIPVVVLINHNSASASEIVSGTLQDLDRGVIIGGRSYGKGLVQEVKPLGYNTGMKLTVAHYYIPSQRGIQALDYAHRRADGSVSKVPENLRNSFKTKNGRIVKDGGGIEPDINIAAEEPGELLQALTNDGFIFDYATEYFHKYSKIDNPEKFHLSNKEFEDFKKWLLDKDFIHATKEGKALLKFKKEAESNNQFAALKTQYSALVGQLNANYTKEINSNKDAIINLLSGEITERYYFQKGRTLNKLTQDDPSLKKAIEVIQNPKEYQKILGK